MSPPPNPDALCFTDSETITNVRRHRFVYDLAIIRRTRDGARRQIQMFVEVDLADANPYALDVGRFYDRHPLGIWLSSGVDDEPWKITPTVPRRDWPARAWTPSPMARTCDQGYLIYVTQAEAALLWARWTHAATVVGVVPSFDVEAMGDAAAQAGLIAGHRYQLGDITSLVAGYLRGRLCSPAPLSPQERARVDDLTRPPWDLDAMLAELGVAPTPDGEKHTALGDALTVERAWDAMYADGAR